MLALAIILAILLLILCIPVGVDVRYIERFQADVTIGPFGFALYPRKPRPPKEHEQPEAVESDAAEKPKKRIKLTLRDIPELLRIAFDALRRFRRRLSIDLLMLHVLVAAEDPYDAVVCFGSLNAALGALSGPAHRALKIRREDVQTFVDVQEKKSVIEFRIKASIQIWEALGVALCTGYAAIVWYIRKKRAAKKAAHVEENMQEEKAS